MAAVVCLMGGGYINLGVFFGGILDFFVTRLFGFSLMRELIVLAFFFLIN